MNHETRDAHYCPYHGTHPAYQPTEEPMSSEHEYDEDDAPEQVDPRSVAYTMGKAVAVIIVIAVLALVLFAAAVVLLGLFLLVWDALQAVLASRA